MKLNINKLLTRIKQYANYTLGKPDNRESVLFNTVEEFLKYIGGIKTYDRCCIYYFKGSASYLHDKLNSSDNCRILNDDIEFPIFTSFDQETNAVYFTDNFFFPDYVKILKDNAKHDSKCYYMPDDGMTVKIEKVVLHDYSVYFCSIP